ncbi:MAG: radical SAM protein [Nanoarchaeota archaeon]|nr:B12-binding domain-containing radical SAM protein [Nanoarchaeota archaeon]
MRIAFVNPFPYYAKGINTATIYPPIGLAYMAAVLRKRGLECIIIDANILRMTNERVLKKLSKFDPDVVGIMSNVVLARAAVELSKKIKNELKKPVIIGGPYATSMIERTLQDSDALCVVRGEGEETIVDLLNNLNSLSKVKSISFKDRGRIKHNPNRELIKDLDSLPFPAYDLLPDFKLYQSRSRKVPMSPILTSRGCPYGCIFCNKNIFGRVFRYRSAENIIEEIEMLVNDYGVKQIDILDDNFTLIMENAEKVLDMIIERKIDIKINLQNGVRADRLTKNLVKKMKRAGVFKVGIGIESGDEKILNVIKKSLDLKKVNQAIRWFREEGIITYGFFMIGLPYETKEDVEKTISFAKHVNPHIANFSVTIPFPGTELYQMIERDGEFIKPTTSGSEGGFFSAETYYKLHNLNRKDVIYYEREAFRSFYLRPVKMLDLLFTIKSVNELKWTIKAGFEIFKGVFR